MPTEAPAPARADQGRSFARTPHAAGDTPPETLPAGASEPSAMGQAPAAPRAEPGRRERAGRAGGAAAAASAPAVVSEPAPASEPARTSVRAGRRLKSYIVVVAMDLSEPGGRAWRFAFDLAALRGETEIHAVVVGPRQVAPAVRDVTTPGASSPPSLRVLQHRFADGQARLMAMHFRTGRPDRAIVSLARELSADLIVVATHPQSRLQRLFGGSTADRIARNAPCPVVVVRPKEDDDADAADYDPRLR
ncbi:universal stress protein [Sorangium atrum]|uniref:Universal stress protein n=1 Tax=Sorangium atrum TaxID=2995308 RepID=A0ABT5CD35_9BACT|nr:universal stress protein [Sorangium aterium]MDC0683684.1 universal stress protein [Sorangium aterium]